MQKLELIYSVGNGAYCFANGPALITIDGRLLFDKRADAIAAANNVGLTVTNNGTVVTVATAEAAAAKRKPATVRTNVTGLPVEEPDMPPSEDELATAVA